MSERPEVFGGLMKGNTYSTSLSQRIKRRQSKRRLLTLVIVFFVLVVLFSVVLSHEIINGKLIDNNEQVTRARRTDILVSTVKRQTGDSFSTVPPMEGLISTPPYLLDHRDSLFSTNIPPDTPHDAHSMGSSSSVMASTALPTRDVSDSLSSDYHPMPERDVADKKSSIETTHTQNGVSESSSLTGLSNSSKVDMSSSTPTTASPNYLISSASSDPGNSTAYPCLGFSEGVSRAALHCANAAANRAPLSSIRLAPLPTTKNPQMGMRGDALCFATGGSAVPSPAWADPLMNALVKDGVYETALALLREDPWYILIGWVPERFMPPQKPGRRANGNVMLPQTKGQNASYYLRTYGAVWHASFKASRMNFHFQLVHRNAIAVCIRERIHLHQYYCQPSSDGAVVKPILVYVCPCRHCRVETKKSVLPRQRMSSIPEEPPLVRPPNTTHFQPSLKSSASSREESVCVDAISAPWLVNTSIIASFPYEGKENDIDGLLAVQADSNGFVTVVIFNTFWRDHLHNFVYSFTQKAKLRNLIVAALDDEALKICSADRLPCLNASMFAEQEESLPSGKGFTRKVTEELSWVKPRLAIAVLRRGYGFLLADLDITWNLNPLRYLLGSGVALIHQCDSTDSLSINSGFYMALPTPRVLRFFTALMTFRPDESADQSAMRLFMKYDHTHGVSHRCFSRFVFNMKCNYKRDRSVKVINGRETFIWMPYSLIEPPSWVMMHATCLSGAKDKVRYFRTIRAWFLEELDNKTGTLLMPKPFCVSLPRTKTDGPSIVQNVWGVTPHTPLYHEMTPDDTYLRERH